MNILSISTDAKILEQGSASRVRQQEYARRFGAMTVIVCTRNKYPQESNSGALTVIPTQSSSAILYGWDVLRIARTAGKCDVVTVQDPFETGLIGLLVARWWKVPLHVQVHTDFTTRGFVEHSVLNKIRRMVVWLVLRNAARIRTVSQHSAEVMRARGIEAPITVLPIFVDLGKFSSITRLKHPRFMISLAYIGRLEREKNPRLAIEALRAARAAGHDAGLTITGEGSERAYLEELVSSYGLEQYVEFVGWKEDTTEILSLADVVLVPSQYEGYGLVIVEALATGVPVIATDVGVAREAGALVVSDKKFAQEVVHWIKNGPRKASLLKYPYRDFDDYAKRYVADIQSCVK